jgi:hypothetical protein
MTATTMAGYPTLFPETRPNSETASALVKPGWRRPRGPAGRRSGDQRDYGAPQRTWRRTAAGKRGRALSDRREQIAVGSVQHCNHATGETPRRTKTAGPPRRSLARYRSWSPDCGAAMPGPSSAGRVAVMSGFPFQEPWSWAEVMTSKVMARGTGPGRELGAWRRSRRSDRP